MRRQLLLLLGGAAVLATATLVPATVAQAAPTLGVTVVHGLGPTTALDLYVDEELAIADFQYGEQQSIGTLEQGTHNVLMCNHDAAPPDPLPGTGCPAGFVSANTGVDLAFDPGVSYTLVLGYPGTEPAIGRPRPMLFPDNLACLNAGRARETTLQASVIAQPVDVLIDGVEVASDLPPSTGSVAEGPAGSFPYLIRDSATTTTIVDVPTATFLAANNTVKILVGNPQFDAGFAVLTRVIPVDTCTTASTSSTSTSIATTSTTVRSNAGNSNAGNTATPRFTG